MGTYMLRRHMTPTIENVEDVETIENVDYESLNYQDLVAYAKSKGIKASGVKRVDIIKELGELENGSA